MRVSSVMPIFLARARSSSLRNRRRARISAPMQRSAAAARTPSGAPPVPMTACSPVPATATEMAAMRSPSSMSLMRAPLARTSATSFSWRGRSRITTVRSWTSRSSESAMIFRFSATLRSRSTLPLAGPPTTSFSMYVSGACSRPPLSDTAIVASAFARPFATGFVPSSGSTAMSTSGPSPRPTVSPMYSIGASSRSPSPMTTVPWNATSSIALRIASTAASSARSLSPCPIQCAAEIAAASVMRTSSRLEVRSVGIGGPSMGETLPASARRCTTAKQSLRGILDTRQWIAHRRLSVGVRRVRKCLDRLDAGAAHRLVTGTDHPRDRDDGDAAAFRSEGHGMGELAVDALAVDATLAGDDEVRSDQPLDETARVEDQRRSGDQPRIKKCDEPSTEATGRTGTRHASHIATNECFDHVRVPRERGLELALDLRRRAFLRSVDRGRALGAEQRIPHVTRDVDRRSNEPWIGLTFDARQTHERASALEQLATVRVEESVAERARHAGAAVVRRAATY